MDWLYFLGSVLLVIIVLGMKVVQQYERGVVFRLGKVRSEVKEPGLTIIIPLIDVMRKVNMRTMTMPIPSQKVITRDNVSIDVAAVAYYRVVEPIKSLVEIDNVMVAINQISQTTVRNIVGQHPLDEVLSSTDKINEQVMVILESTVEQWGVRLTRVELKDIQLPDSMQRAMAKQAEADIINAHPIALQLRNLQVLTEIAAEKNSTIIFPAQFMDTVSSIKEFMLKEAK